MNALIPIRKRADGSPVVSGRELHAFLELGRDYTTWFKKMTEYGLVEGVDYVATSGEVYPRTGENLGGRPRVDHVVTIDAAKEIAMLQRTAKGKEARLYFIEVEKRARAAVRIPGTYAEALEAAAAEARRADALEAKAAEDAPKVHFADAVAASESTILIGDLAKILKGNGYDTGANRLFAQLRDEGYLIRRAGSDYNMPTQRAMDLGLFEVKERTRQEPDGAPRIMKTTKVTGKGQQYFIARYAPKAVAA